MEDSPATTMRVAAGKLASPLQSAVNNQGEQLEKLGGLLVALEERLKPVVNEATNGDNQKVSDDRDFAPAAPIVDQVRRQTVAVGILQRRLSTLLEMLEV